MATHIASDIIQGEMSNIIRNPKASVRYSLDLLEKLTNGDVVIVDASNPFTYALEMGIVNTS